MKTELDKYAPCKDALKFRRQHKTFEEAWQNCPRGDWMLWIAQKVGVNIRTLTLAKGYCAKTVIHLMKDERSVNAVKTSIRFGRYLATKEELYAASDAADDAYDAASDADAASAAASAVYDASAARNRLKTADICRKYLTKDVLRLIKKNT